VSQQLETLLKDPCKVKMPRREANLRFDKARSMLLRAPSQKEADKAEIPVSILHGCFHKSEDPTESTNRLLSFLTTLQLKGGEPKIIETLLYFFIYHNHSNSQAVRDAIVARSTRSKTLLEVNLDRVVDSDESAYSILPDFGHAKRLVELLREWE
jgi:hypothetical protein